MVNPLSWKPEHIVALAIAIVAGAAVGVVVGFALARSSLGLWWWVSWHYSDEVITWAAIGALVAGAVVYCHRAFSN